MFPIKEANQLSVRKFEEDKVKAKNPLTYEEGMSLKMIVVCHVVWELYRGEHTNKSHRPFHHSAVSCTKVDSFFLIEIFIVEINDVMVSRCRLTTKTYSLQKTVVTIDCSDLYASNVTSTRLRHQLHEGGQLFTDKWLRNGTNQLAQNSKRCTALSP